jgi:glycosyltransferase involved in cell wall biosynthesis
MSFEVVTQDGFAYADGDGIRIHPVPLGRERDHLRSWLRFCESAVAAVRKERLQFDCVHCHDWMTMLAGVVLREETGRPLLINVHLPQAGGQTKVVERLGIAAADHVIVNSVAVRDELGESCTPLSVIPNGVDTDRYRPGGKWPDDDGYILFVGRLVPQKGVGTLLQAMAALLHRTSARLVIIGDGHSELFLQRAARSFGCADRVEFAGWASGAELVGWYQNAQFVVMPSIYEPFGIVALEAMACGRPVIAAASGGLTEIIDDGATGLLVPAGDPLRLAARMFELLDDPAKRARIGAAARSHALQYDWSCVAAQTAAVFDSLQPQTRNGHRREVIAARARHVVETLADTLGSIAPNLMALGGTG